MYLYIHSDIGWKWLGKNWMEEEDLYIETALGTITTDRFILKLQYNPYSMILFYDVIIRYIFYNWKCFILFNNDITIKGRI